MIRAEMLVAGTASGEVFAMSVPLSFWGGYDAVSGTVIDRHHPDHGTHLAGKILLMERGRGSSSGSSVLAEAIRLGTAPAAIVMRMRDAIVVTGAMVAAELYGTVCPILRIASDADWTAILAAKSLQISAEGIVTIAAKAAA